MDYLNIRNKINVYSRLVLFPLYFTKFSLNTVSIRVKFGSSKEKITTRRMCVYLIPDTKTNIYLLFICFIDIGNIVEEVELDTF